MMKLLIWVYLLVITMISWLSFLRAHKHILMTLLSLELIGLMAYLNVYISLSTSKSELFFILVYLTFLVCEGALGLSMLVVQIRGIGSDYLNTVNMMKW